MDRLAHWMTRCRLSVTFSCQRRLWGTFKDLSREIRFSPDLRRHSHRDPFSTVLYILSHVIGYPNARQVHVDRPCDGIRSWRRGSGQAHLTFYSWTLFILVSLFFIVPFRMSSSLQHVQKLILCRRAVSTRTLSFKPFSCSTKRFSSSVVVIVLVTIRIPVLQQIISANTAPFKNFLMKVFVDSGIISQHWWPEFLQHFFLISPFGVC